jgi:hypothetical protein
LNLYLQESDVSMNRRDPASQPRTPAIRTSNGVQSPRLEMQTARHIHLWRAVTLWLAAGCGVLSGYSGGSKNCVNFAVLDHLFR